MLACLIGSLERRRWLLGLPLIALPWLTASPKAMQLQGPPDLVIAVANVNIRQRDPEALLGWLQRHSANVVVLTELSPDYANALKARHYGGFIYQALHPLASPPGLGILSDRPLQNVRLIPDRLGALRMEADINIEGRSVHFVALHPKPPMATRKYMERDRLLHDLAATGGSQPMIIAGDINATPWSSALLGIRGKRLARITGWAPTYPSEGGGIVGIGIDHVLVSPQFGATEAERGPDIGSDHLPVRAGLRWRDK